MHWIIRGNFQSKWNESHLENKVNCDKIDSFVILAVYLYFQGAATDFKVQEACSLYHRHERTSRFHWEDILLQSFPFINAKAEDNMLCCGFYIRRKLMILSRTEPRYLDSFPLHCQFQFFVLEDFWAASWDAIKSRLGPTIWCISYRTNAILLLEYICPTGLKSKSTITACGRQSLWTFRYFSTSCKLFSVFWSMRFFCDLHSFLLSSPFWCSISYENSSEPQFSLLRILPCLVSAIFHDLLLLELKCSRSCKYSTVLIEIFRVKTFPIPVDLISCHAKVEKQYRNSFHHFTCCLL